jgi:hypothetical protein
MTSSEITPFEQNKQAAISNTVDQVSSSLNQTVLLTLKVAEYLSLAAFVGAGSLTLVLPDNQIIIVFGAVSLAVFIFLFLVNRQLFQDANNAANQSEIAKKAELYTYLMTDNNLGEKNLITPAREKALRYCQELIDDYKKTRRDARSIYYIFQMITVILSGITPILVLVDKLETGEGWFKWLPVICPAIASIVASIVTSFPFQKNWIAANTAVELLEAEQEKFVLGVTPAYRCYDLADESQRQQKAKAAIENFLNQVNTIHLKQIQDSGEKQVKREEQTEQAQSAESNQAQS